MPMHLCTVAQRHLCLQLLSGEATTQTLKGTTMLSIATVKEHLPDVHVTIGRKVYRGQVSGRHEKFPVVTVDFGTHTWRAEYSWQAIARAIESETPLTV